MTSTTMTSKGKRMTTPSNTKDLGNKTKGSLLMFSTGSYSDYQVLGTFEVIEDFNLFDEQKNYVKDEELPKTIFHEWEGSHLVARNSMVSRGVPWSQEYWLADKRKEVLCTSTGGFMAYMTTKGLLKELAVEEIYDVF